MFRKLFLATSVAVVVLTLSTITHAETITLTSVSGNTNVTATISNFTLTPVAGTNTKEFCFTLTNTSTAGSITAIGFDLPGLEGGTFTLESRSDSDFKLEDAVKAQAGVKGTFDFALITGKNFGGGKVDLGIGPQNSNGTFNSGTFCVVGNFGNLTASEIARSVFARFQGIGPRDLSDVAGVGNQPPPPPPIPEPTTMLLLGTGLVGVAAKARKRRKDAKEQSKTQI